MNLGLNNLINESDEYNSHIYVPIQSWLFNQPVIGAFENYNFLMRNHTEAGIKEKIDIAFLTLDVEDDIKQRFEEIHNESCCYMLNQTASGI